MLLLKAYAHIMNYKLVFILILSLRWQCKDPSADTIAQLKAYTYTSTKGKHTD